MEPVIARRELLAAAGLSMLVSAAEGGLPTRKLGRTGANVSILGVGGAHLGRIREQAEITRFLHMAVDEGMTFMDNAWEYNQGRSEEVMGIGLAEGGYRQKAFLMTKVCSREYKGAMEQLEDSLRKLKTDVIDLWQFHECNYHNDPDWVMEKGALRAAEEARKQGKVRFIGFTGHKAPSIHLRMLDVKFAWDAAQMPNNVMDAGFLSFRQQVMPVCQKKNVGIVGMKGVGGDGRVVREGLLSVEECYRYCLSQPVSVQVVGLSSVDMLKEAIRIGRAFRPLSAAEATALQAKVKEVQGDGRYELFKTSKRYDSGYHRTQHGFETTGA